MEVRNKKFSCYIDGFTHTTYIMAVLYDPAIRMRSDLVFSVATLKM
jgi:hypothetical protein